MKEKDLERFMGRVKKTDGCWIWTAGTTPKGYGLFCCEGVGWYAHRLIWTHHNGPIPEGLVIRHSCDNPSCVNPSHLESGTQKQNLQDMVDRGRKVQLRGAECKNKAKLTWEQAAEIRRLYIKWDSQFGIPGLAKMFGVSKSTIQAITSGNSYVQ